MIKKLINFFNDEEGASMVEYALLVGLIAVISILALTNLGAAIRDLFVGVDGALPPPPAAYVAP
jgi:pilus assembly protein Flp/PilA